MSDAAAAASGGTDWPLVWLATLGGATAAMHIGKAAAALPQLRVDLSATLFQASVYLAMISVLAALTGLLLGRATARVGMLRAGVLGLVLMSLASFASAVAVTPGQLLAARIVEAVGLPLIVTAFPTIVQQATAARHRGLALGLWAAWLPAGVAMAMALAFVMLEPAGWRAYFVACGAASLLLAGLLALARRRRAFRGPRGAGPRVSLRLSARTLPVFRMAFVFLMFSAANMVFMGFLPSLLVDSMQASAAAATAAGFVAAMLLLPANVASGAAVGRGISRRLLLTLSFGGIAVGSLLLFWEGGAIPVRIAAALVVATATGIAPAVVWASVPGLAEEAEVPPPLVSGLVYQAAGLGQSVGPMLAGGVVDASGAWFAAALVIAACCAMALLTTRRVQI